MSARARAFKDAKIGRVEKCLAADLPLSDCTLHSVCHCVQAAVSTLIAV